MFRKITLALAAATVVATAAIPTAASAHWTGWRHHHRHHHHHYAGVSTSYYAYAPRCYTTKRFVRTHWGWRPVYVRHCR
jgi:hypothetical protein